VEVKDHYPSSAPIQAFQLAARRLTFFNAHLHFRTMQGKSQVIVDSIGNLW
jgi:hypothetical protein